jgi:hypothetical protein
MGVRHKIFDIDDVLASFNYGETSVHLETFADLRYELECDIAEMIENPSEDFEGDLEVLEVLDYELQLLDKNITTFRDALVIHENMINSFKMIDEVRCRICIN